MSYSVEFTESAKKTLKRLDPQQNRMIMKWIIKNLRDCDDPRARGKALAGGWKGYWRYRVGDYRLIADIQDNVLKILFVNIGHRKDVY